MNDTLLQTWLESIQSGRRLSLQDMLAQLAESDPRLAPFTRFLAQERAPRGGQEDQVVVESTAEDVDEPDPDHSELHAVRSRLKEARRVERTLLRMDAELQELRTRNETLAAALGACPMCWGEDPECEECDGRGHPGAAKPDSELFHHFIIPAVRRVERLGMWAQQPGNTAKRKSEIQQ
ncbi:hypothetical protein [Nannocystis sp.]|uniref:hypothetical protein n=1 Tax=Nannocystis sp. TaxID=1962667 RepID=UPI0025E484BA|nr:hypothetical protein [Nannocystis sp.]MBK7830505.1 hypothetical protein [Nannocystis sp.]